MKKLLMTLLVSFLVMSAFISPIIKNQSGITGLIEPAEGAKKVWAIAGTDSVSVIPIEGKFSISVKPGNWNLIVEAIAPYKNMSAGTILVLEGSPTDAGVIKLFKN